MTENQHVVILAYSTSYALRAEKVLNQAEIQTKLIPVPRHLSSNCGVCVRVDKADRAKAIEVLEDAKVPIEGYFDI